MKRAQHMIYNIRKRVAPCAGAWVETRLRWLMGQPWRESPPVRGRGLKQQEEKVMASDGTVAPCAGAWVETRL